MPPDGPAGPGDPPAPGLGAAPAPGERPGSGPGGKRIQSVLFVCAMNAVRSPMAEALARHYFGKGIYVQSAGVRQGERDPFVVTVLDEIGIDGSRHKPRTLSDLEEWEGLNFDLIVSLSPEAHHAALELTRTLAADVEYWPTFDPTATQGSRDQMLDAYRNVRDGLSLRIRLRLKGSASARP